MTAFSTVVAALGDSDRALDVVRTSATLARRKSGGTLFFAHAVARMPAAMERVLFPYACLGDDADAIVAEVVQHAARSLAGRWGKEFGAPAPEVLRVGYGPVPDATLELAAALGPDLFVVGPGGPDAPGHLGPVAHELLTRAAWPVWCCRRRDDALTVRNVAVALDLTPDAPHLLTHALRLAEAHGATLHPIAVAPHNGVGDHAGVTGPVRDMHGKTRKQMEQLSTRVIASMSLHFPEERQLAERLRDTVYVQGDPSEAIAAHAAEVNADVVVIGRRQSRNGSGLGRVAEAVARYAPCDVLVVPTESFVASSAS